MLIHLNLLLFFLTYTAYCVFLENTCVFGYHIIYNLHNNIIIASIDSGVESLSNIYVASIFFIYEVTKVSEERTLSTIYVLNSSHHNHGELFCNFSLIYIIVFRFKTLKYHYVIYYYSSPRHIIN